MKIHPTIQILLTNINNVNYEIRGDNEFRTCLLLHVPSAQRLSVMFIFPKPSKSFYVDKEL